jgi:hypothetical protein
MSEQESRVEELIEEFDWDDGVYKREEMEEAITLREEIIPHLIGILEEVADDPEQYAREEHYANVYAVALLAHFREPAALLPIIRAFCIPKEPLDMLWGDMVTETLPALLVQTCNGKFDAIKELILDKEAPAYVRGAAVEALTYAVARGMAGREEIIAFLSSLLTGTEAEEDSYFWGNVVCAISDLHPQEAMPAIRQAFANGLVPLDYVGPEEIERDLARDREEVLAELRTMVDYRVPQDVHGYLEWFASFQEKAPLPPPPVYTDSKALRKKKNINRAKAKLAKKARKKNRR